MNKTATVHAMDGVQVEDTSKKIDYNKIVDQFGCKLLEKPLLEKFEEIIGEKPHHWLRRGMYFAHRDFDLLLDSYSKGDPFFLYTGRGPSGDMHMGHLIPFMMNAYLQRVFKCPMIIQMTDDEKVLLKDEFEYEEATEYLYRNIKDIIACGFDPERTYIFSNYQSMGRLYPTVMKIRKCLTLSQIRGCFGFGDSDNIGKWAFPPTQMVPCFSSAFEGILVPVKDPIPIAKDLTVQELQKKFPKKKKKKNNKKNKKLEGLNCLIPCAIDQDPYFRLTRDIANRLNFKKPHTLYSTFMPGLNGPGTKMSTSIPSSAIFLTDSANQIKKKINKYAYSGGGETIEEHRKNGANLNVDVSYQYLSYFLEDDEELAKIGKEYGEGKLLTGEVKKILIGKIQVFMKEFQERRKNVTDEMVKQFMSVRPLKFKDELITEMKF